MEELRIYLNSMPFEDQIKFANKCKTTIGYLRTAIHQGKELGAIISVNIERESNGAVTRQMLHPKNFLMKWPELGSNKAA